MLLRSALAIVFGLALVLWTMPIRTATAPVARAAELPFAIRDVYVHTPRDVPRDTPLQVLVALHGIGGNGEQFAAPLIKDADRNHWLLIAPTIAYGDWTDPNEVAREDPRLIRWLDDYLDQLTDYVGLAVKPRILLLGHSRGAQLAHRFALFEPRRVLGIAALAAGTYTLPSEQTAQGVLMRFPFGLADLSVVAGHAFNGGQLVDDTQFWLGVGSEDNNPSDLPRAWDPYLGTTRVQRARVFQAALHALGARSVLVAFLGEKHTMSPDMVISASSFLRAVDLIQLDPAQSPGSPIATHLKSARRKF